MKPDTCETEQRRIHPNHELMPFLLGVTNPWELNEMTMAPSWTLSVLQNWTFPNYSGRTSRYLSLPLWCLWASQIPLYHRDTWREQSPGAPLWPSTGTLPKGPPASPFLYSGSAGSSHSGNPTAPEGQHSKEAFVKPARGYRQAWAVPSCTNPHPALLIMPNKGSLSSGRA